MMVRPFCTNSIFLVYELPAEEKFKTRRELWVLHLTYHESATLRALKACIGRTRWLGKFFMGTELINQCWPMVKICPEIINFLFFCPEKNKILPKKKICPNFWKIYPKNTNLPSHRVPPMLWIDQEMKPYNFICWLHHWLVLCKPGLCIVNVYWCRNSYGFLIIFTFRLWFK